MTLSLANVVWHAVPVCRVFLVLLFLYMSTLQ